ncbi:MAG: SMEK domain-containing protein [Phaeodactylibacter sp.]|uniref:SMEK domain-containing protein n=1 Tax=Phaeodactylibacter sp. TaxID=1940289 RepID=UPI0032EDB284
MNRQAFINEIIKYSSRFTEEVKQYNSIGLYDINIHAENFLIPVLNKTLDLELENLNISNQKNFPSIDLADFKNRVGIQISSTSTTQKVTDTLDKFVKHSLYEYFDVVYIFFISDKQKTYPADKINKVASPHLQFDSKEHILDNSDLVKRLSNLSLEKLKYLARIYKHEFSDIQIESREKQFKSGYLESENEKLYSNLLKIKVPQKLYSADLYLDEELIINRMNIYRESKGWSSLKSIKDKGKLLNNELMYQKIYLKDWVLRSGRLYTFRNLHDNNEPFSRVIDKGTIEEYDSNEYYEENEDYLRIFKNLLRNTLIQDCFYKGLEWVHKKKILRFKIDPNNRGAKKVMWVAKNKATKTVIFEMINKKENHLICYKHLAFKPSFELLNKTWYLVINSTWSFTNPGGKRQSRFEETYLSGIKRLESNKSIYYFYRFWSYYLRYEDLFSHKGKILKLEEFKPLSFMPKLNDEKWLPVREEKELSEDDILTEDTELSQKLFD